MITHILTVSLYIKATNVREKNALRALILGVPWSMFYNIHKRKTPVYI